MVRTVRADAVPDLRRHVVDEVRLRELRIWLLRPRVATGQSRTMHLEE